MVQNSNSFGLVPEKGTLTQKPDFSVFDALVKSDEATALVPGQAVVLVDNASAMPEVTASALTTDSIFGFVVYDIINGSFAATKGVKIATKGAVQLMQAGGAIARGGVVEYLPAGQKVVAFATGTKVGIALDKAAADGDLIRVLIETPQSE